MRLHLFHRWQIVKDMYSHEYQQCRICGKRRIWWNPQFCGLTVTDNQWVETGEWRKMGPPPWGRFGVVKHDDPDGRVC